MKKYVVSIAALFAKLTSTNQKNWQTEVTSEMRSSGLIAMSDNLKLDVGMGLCHFAAVWIASSTALFMCE